MKINGLIKIALLVSGCVIAMSSFAAVNYAGSDCREELGTGLDLDWTGAGINTSAGSLWVVCPVPHTDFDGTFHNGAIESGFFTAVDEHDGQNITCRFRSIWQDGSVLTVRLAASGTTSGHGDHIQKIGLGGINLDTQESVYVLSCSMPGRDPASSHSSFIRGYRVDQ